MRSEAQKVVSRALVNIQEHVKTLLKISSTKNSAAHTFMRTIKEFLTVYLPQLATHTFIEADTLTNRASHDTWLLLKQIQDVGNYTWKTIETARSEFYSDLFDELVIIHAIVEIPLPTPLLSESFRLQ